MVCKGACPKYKAKKPTSGGRYEAGQRRCQTCEIWLMWEGIWCPCCGYRLRTKPRNKKYKERLREIDDYATNKETSKLTMSEQLVSNPDA